VDAGAGGDDENRVGSAEGERGGGVGDASVPDADDALSCGLWLGSGFGLKKLVMLLFFDMAIM